MQMPYWFLMMVTENSWASKCLEAELKTQKAARVCFEYMCTSWKHFGLQTHSLLLQIAEHPPSPMVFLWEQSTSEGRLCSLSVWAKAFGIRQLPARHRVPSGDRGTIHQLQQEENQTHCQPFSAQIHVSAFRQKRVWALFGPSSQQRLSVHAQLSAPRCF